MRPEHPRPRRVAPGDRALLARLLELARRTRERPMDEDLPDRVLSALGLSVPRRALPRPPRTRRRALAAGLAALLALLLLPPGHDGGARLAQAPLFPAPGMDRPSDAPPPGAPFLDTSNGPPARPAAGARR